MLDVIGAGFGRTGTNSLREALNMLGVGPCHHMYEMRETPERLSLWHDAVDRLWDGKGGRPEWEAMFEGYRAQVDWPGALFWRELTALCPEAKVVLSVREPAGWHASFLKTIVPTIRAAGQRETELLNDISRFNARTIEHGVFGGRMEDANHAIAVFEAHNAAVRAEIASDRLLVWEVGDGWEPLCAHLGVPVPAAPFPRGNDAATFRAQNLGGS